MQGLWQSIPRVKESLNTSSKSGDSLYENSSKNSMGKPSGPGALRLCIALIDPIVFRLYSMVGLVSFLGRCQYSGI